MSGQTDEVARGVHVNVKVHVTGGAMDVLWNAALPFFAALDSGGPPINGTAEDVVRAAVGVDPVCAHVIHVVVVTEHPEPGRVQPSGAVHHEVTSRAVFRFAGLFGPADNYAMELVLDRRRHLRALDGVD